MLKLRLITMTYKVIFLNIYVLEIIKFGNIRIISVYKLYGLGSKAKISQLKAIIINTFNS
jgi:hypothetical protein